MGGRVLEEVGAVYVPALRRRRWHLHGIWVAFVRIVVPFTAFAGSWRGGRGVPTLIAYVSEKKKIRLYPLSLAERELKLEAP